MYKDIDGEVKEMLQQVVKENIQALYPEKVVRDPSRHSYQKLSELEYEHDKKTRDATPTPIQLKTLEVLYRILKRLEG